jgi:hypothetical protein
MTRKNSAAVAATHYLQHRFVVFLDAHESESGSDRHLSTVNTQAAAAPCALWSTSNAKQIDAAALNAMIDTTE